MNKSRLCFGRTINLAKLTAIQKPQSVVIHEKVEPKTEEINLIEIPPIVAEATIKKWDGHLSDDVKCTNLPVLLDFPSVGQTYFGTMTKLLGLSMKSALAGAIVYWTYDIGIWGPAAETQKIYRHMCHLVTSSNLRKE